MVAKLLKRLIKKIFIISLLCKGLTDSILFFKLNADMLGSGIAVVRERNINILRIETLMNAWFTLLFIIAIIFVIFKDRLSNS